MTDRLDQYVAEEGEACQLQAAVVCANPFNLDVSSTLMFKDWFSRNVYLKVMGGKSLFTICRCEISDNSDHSRDERPHPKPQGGD